MSEQQSPDTGVGSTHWTPMAKPPLGVKPRKLHLEARAAELHRALHEYWVFNRGTLCSEADARSYRWQMAHWADELASNYREQASIKP